MSPPEIPKVDLQLWRSDVVVMYDWLMSVDFSDIPITHPAQKQALTDLLTAFELQADVMGITEDDIKRAQAEVAQDMGW